VRLNVGYVEELVLQKSIKGYFKFNKFAIIVMVKAQSYEIYVQAVKAKEL